jgi:hypothetical protein
MNDGDEDDTIDRPEYKIELGKSTYFQAVDDGIDIRQWWITQSGALKPSRRGVTMPLKRYVMLRDSLKELSNSLKDVCLGRNVNLKIHLGANMFASVQSPYRCVNLRQWFQDTNGVNRPGNGVSLTVALWDKFLLADAGLYSILPELNNTLRCMEEADHGNQLGFLKCSECNPDGFMDW